MSKPDTQTSRSGRDDDTGHNNPSRSPTSAKPFRESAEQGRKGGSGPADREVVDPGPLRRRIRRSLWMLLGFAFLVTAVFYLLVLDFILRMQGLPLVLQVPAWVLVGGASLFVVWAGLKLIKFWFSLRTFKQVDLVSPYQRAHDKKPDPQKMDASKQVLSRYLEFVTTRPAIQEHWQKIWPESAERSCAEVVYRANKLLETRSVDTPSWLRELESEVLQPLDDIARRRIKHYAKRVGIKTAISPFPLVDSLAVLYNAFLLLRELAALYGRRLNRYETGILVLLVIFQVYVAGETQEVTEAGMDEVQNFIAEGTAGFTNRVTALISPKVAEGVLNGYVLYRLGRYAQRNFRPLRS